MMEQGKLETETLKGTKLKIEGLLHQSFPNFMAPSHGLTALSQMGTTCANSTFGSYGRPNPMGMLPPPRPRRSALVL